MGLFNDKVRHQLEKIADDNGSVHQWAGLLGVMGAASLPIPPVSGPLLIGALCLFCTEQLAKKMTEETSYLEQESYDNEGNRYTFRR